MNKSTFKSLIPTAIAIALMSNYASAVPILPDFTVNEASVEGAGGTITADKLNGAYTEVIAITGTSFTTAAYGDIGQFLTNDGQTAVAGTQLGSSYGLYALFSAVGVVTPGAVTTFDATSASFSLFIDPLLNTLKSFAGTSVSTANAGDDYLIGSASILASDLGVLVPPIGGFFDLVFSNFTRTAAGASYFTAPNPFYVTVNVDGDFDNFNPTGTQTINGDFSAVFVAPANVPEPGSLALLGLGLMGLGFVSRRKAAKAA